MTDFEQLRRTAQALHLKNELGEAERLYGHLISNDPQDCDAANLGALLRRQGRNKESMELYKKWLRQGNRSVELYLNAINCAIDSNEVELGMKWIEQCSSENKTCISLEKARARLFLLMRRDKEAITILEKIDSENENDLEAKNQLARAYYQDGQNERSIEVYKDLYKRREMREECASNIITILNECGNTDEANKYFNQLDNAVKCNINVRRAMAFLKLTMQNFEDAYGEYKILCHEEPIQPLNWLNCCASLRGLKSSYEALRVIKKGSTLHPQHKKIRYALMQCLAETGKLGSAAQMINDELRDCEELNEQLMFNIQFIGEGYKLVESQKLRNYAKAWASNQNKLKNLWADYMKEKKSTTKIRIAYFSQDFCDHPVGRFIRPIIKHHDRDKFEVYCINTGTINDKLTERIRKSSDRWIDITRMNNIEAASLIASHQIDIIVELGGYTGGSRLGVLLYKCAPTQLSYLGYFAPTYIKTIDGWIGDPILFKKNSETHKKSHKQILIDDGYMAYEEEIDARKDRIECKIFRFGTFNHARKLSNETIELFSKLMQVNFQAKLVLKSISFNEEEGRNKILKRLMEYGIKEKDIEILPWVEGRKSHLECYRNIDVALDPFPYGGATTTCEALFMGVPVITLIGRSMVENLSASILKSAGKKQWIADNKEEYIKIATKLMKEGLNTAEKREALSEEIKKSKFGNTKLLTENLEYIYCDEANKSEKQFSREFIKDAASPN